jgi:hypothetical protein
VHDWHGAPAHERDRHRVGAHAVACDAAGGVEGAARAGVKRTFACLTFSAAAGLAAEAQWYGAAGALITAAAVMSSWRESREALTLWRQRSRRMH